MKKEHKKTEEREKKVDIKDVEEEIVVEQEGELEILGKQAAEYLDGWKRSQAEFENYKKRQADSQKDLIKYATSNILLQIIPIIDNFHASTAHVPEDQKDNPWVTGIMYIQKQLENVLSDNGVEEIAVKAGENFDPIYHEAIEDKECVHCKSEHKYQNKIKKVIQKGYRLGEKVIRPARVVVE